MKHRFDICLMNPPFDKNLHLRFLEKVCDISDKTISIQPISWLQNIFADENKNSKINTIKLTNVELVGKLNTLFDNDGRATYDVGIFKVDNKATINKDLLYKFIELYPGEIIDSELIKSIKNKILDYCKSGNNLENKIKSGKIDENTKYCIVMPILVGNPGSKIDKLFCENSNRWGRIFYKGKSDGKTPSEYKKKLSNVINYSNFDYLEFETLIECKNWINSQYSDIMRFITILNCVDAHRRCKFVPYMNDYFNVWTDKQLSTFFNITNEELREIHNYIQLYEKRFPDTNPINFNKFK